MKGDVIVLEEHHKQAARKIVPEIIEKIKGKETRHSNYYPGCCKVAVVGIFATFL